MVGLHWDRRGYRARLYDPGVLDAIGGKQMATRRTIPSRAQAHHPPLAEFENGDRYRNDGSGREVDRHDPHAVFEQAERRHGLDPIRRQ